MLTPKCLQNRKFLPQKGSSSACLFQCSYYHLLDSVVQYSFGILDMYVQWIYLFISFFMCTSEFEELEAVPTSAAIDGPLEPPPATTALVSDAPDESLANYFNVSSLLILNSVYL
jgi:hypothetical protein